MTGCGFDYERAIDALCALVHGLQAKMPPGGCAALQANPIIHNHNGQPANLCCHIDPHMLSLSMFANIGQRFLHDPYTLRFGQR